MLDQILISFKAFLYEVLINICVPLLSDQLVSPLDNYFPAPQISRKSISDGYAFFAAHSSHYGVWPAHSHSFCVYLSHNSSTAFSHRGYEKENKDELSHL